MDVLCSSAQIAKVLSEGLIVGLTFTPSKGDDDAEYFFMSTDPSDKNSDVVVTICRSRMSDPFAILGRKISSYNFYSMYVLRSYQYARRQIFTRDRVRVYPRQWYPAFQTQEESEKMITALKELNIVVTHNVDTSESKEVLGMLHRNPLEERLLGL
jgi:hypothetical protein